MEFVQKFLNMNKPTIFLMSIVINLLLIFLFVKFVVEPLNYGLKEITKTLCQTCKFEDQK